MTDVKLRWSSARACARKSVYEATLEPDRDLFEIEQRIMYRGRCIGREFVNMLASGNSGKVWACSGDHHWIPPSLRAESQEKADYLAEVPIRWKHGVGHIDVYVVSSNLIIEVLSSAHASPAMRHSKLIQAAGYALGFSQAKGIALCVLSPVDYTEERITVERGSSQWVTLEAEVKEIIARLDTWREDGTLPERTCKVPNEARGRFCRHAVTCFQGWEPEPLDPLTSPRAQELVESLYDLKQQIKFAHQETRLTEEEAVEIQDELSELVEPGTYASFGYVLKRSPRRRENFKLGMAKEDSRFDPDLLMEFSSVSEYSVWSVEKAEKPEEDYGEVPF